MTTRMTKIDRIAENVTEIREDVSAIKQHLADMNGKVKSHEDCIRDLEKKIPSNLMWVRVQSIAIGLMGTALGAMGTYLLTR